MPVGLLKLDLQRGSSGRSKHERLREYLVNEMLSGRLKPGQAIPSQRQLVETLGIAQMTIRQAMASLENDGLIRRVQGKGTFVEDDAARKLKRGLDIFALVVPETRSGFYPSLLHGFEVAAGDVHHQAIVCSTDDNVERQANIILQLLDNEVGGLAIVPASHSQTPAFQIRQIQKRGIPVVFCHRRVEGIAAPLLALPFREVGCLAGNTLVKQGHRRVAFFTTQPTPAVQAYEAGLREAFQEGGLGTSLQTVHVTRSMVTLEEKAVWESLQQEFAKPDPPTAIFASFDSLAEMIYLLLPKLGLRVPEDISLVGVGGTWREGAITRRLTSVVIDEIAAGRQAVSLLQEMRRGKRPIDDNEEFVLPLDLYEGETLAMSSARVRK